MANLVKLKRSAVQGKVPLITDLQLGELALNTYDGNLFFKKDDGTASIVSVATLNGTQTLSNKTINNLVVTGDLTISNEDSSYKLPREDSTAGYVVATNGEGQLYFVDPNTLITSSSELSSDNDFGNVTDIILKSYDFGNVGEPTTESVDWGLILIGGNIYPDQLVLPQYTISALPSASAVAQLVYVIDDPDGSVIAFSDGTYWRRTTDRQIIS